MFKLEAIGNAVILKLAPKITQKGSIVLTASAAEESDFCEVVDVGPDCKVICAGDSVLRPSPADYEWIDENDSGQVYLIVKEADIMARVRR